MRLQRSGNPQELGTIPHGSATRLVAATHGGTSPAPIAVVAELQRELKEPGAKGPPTHGMQLPFSPDAFFEVFARYNLALWPVVLTLWLAAAAVVATIVVRPTRVWTHRMAALLLVVLWLWGGAVYHAVYFTAINPAAWVFAAFFVMEAGLLAWFALVRDRLTFGSASPGVRGSGIALALYGLAYPGVNLASGHPYPAMPTFGVPCPTTLVTVGLLLTCHRPPVAVALIPVLWSLIAGSAALSLGVPADLVLLASAVLLVAHVVIGSVPRAAKGNQACPRDLHPTLLGRTTP